MSKVNDAKYDVRLTGGPRSSWRRAHRRLLAVAAFGLAGIAALTSTPAASQMSLEIRVNFAPPELPVYDQPSIPGPDYIWLPGYWAWDDYVQDYFWIPGTWMMAPQPGLLWTPAWWGWQDGIYAFHEGYWAPHVGFYGGVPYGFGYNGSGYEGAYWNRGHVYYNRSVTNVTNVNITNVYNKTVFVNRVTNVSYNGGPTGIQARPSPADEAATHELHVAPTYLQRRHIETAHAIPQLFASANHGRPSVAATSIASAMTGPGVVAAKRDGLYQPAHPHSDATSSAVPREFPRQTTEVAPISPSVPSAGQSDNVRPQTPIDKREYQQGMPGEGDRADVRPTRPLNITQTNTGRTEDGSTNARTFERPNVAQSHSAPATILMHPAPPAIRTTPPPGAPSSAGRKPRPQGGHPKPPPQKDDKQ